MDRRRKINKIDSYLNLVSDLIRNPNADKKKISVILKAIDKLKEEL